MGVDRRVCAVRRPVAVRRRAPRAVACARVAAALQFGVRNVGAGCARGARLPAPGGAAALGWSRGVGDMCGVAGVVSRCGPAVRRVPAVVTTCGAKRRPGRAGALENQIPKRVLAWPWAAAGRAAGAGAGASGDREARRERNRPANPGNGEPNPGDAEGGFRLHVNTRTAKPAIVAVVAVRVWFVKLK